MEEYQIRLSEDGEAGLALVINIRDFGIPEMTRHGSEKDVENLRSALEYLNLKVEVKENLTQNQFLMAILEFAETLENNDVDIGVVCIMSHGEEDSIETADI